MMRSDSGTDDVANIVTVSVSRMDPPTEFISKAADIAAVKAVWEGVADPYQQRLCLDWIVRNLCKIHSSSFSGGETHDAAFKEGRRFVGGAIMEAINSKPRKENKNG